ncbi:plasmid replication protein RepC [Poseidonocella sp. HB161398]|uniref:plasmid replication protein RepC n=1 Tax=Poseidonocella sp. HB161398 TaxID=2320855 RepID=UPI001107AD97|nr:plasmid replication protein RepC [Poseidonocella sp. HB161398]
MIHFRQAPDGAGHPQAADADGTGVPDIRRTGWRRQDESLLRAEQLGREGQGASVAKTEALIALKRAAPLIGLKPAQVMLMDTLCAYSRPQDWEEGETPVVWPSNALLMERTGLALTSLRRHLRRLCEAGLLVFRDSPNGKRWGRRAADGRITEAFGLDLSPLAARAGELRDLHERHAAERNAARRLRQQVTALTRTLADRLELLPPSQQAARRDAFAEIDTPLPRHAGRPELAARAEALGLLLASVDADLAPRGTGTGTHIEDTNQDQKNTCTEAADDDPCLIEPAGPEPSRIHPRQLLEALPSFAAWAAPGTGVESWRDLSAICERLCLMTGIPVHLWQRSRRVLGEPGSVQAMALVLEKSAQGLVRAPASYLAGMIRKAEKGELRLERSIRGRLRLAALP